MKRISANRSANQTEFAPIDGPRIILLEGTDWSNPDRGVTVYRCIDCLGPLVDLSSSAASINLILSSFDPEPSIDPNAFIPFDTAVDHNMIMNLTGARVSDYCERASQVLFD